MDTLTNYETRVALETELFAAIEQEYMLGGIAVLQPGDDFASVSGDIVVIHNVNPGKPQSGEMAGRHGLSPVPGVYIVTFSCLNDPQTIQRAWNLSDVVMRRFYRAALHVEGKAYDVAIGEPYTSNVGPISGTNRVAVSVTIPWRIWQGGYIDE